MTPADTDWLLHNRPFLGAVAFLFGTIVGSFLNVVAYRLPKMMERDCRDQCLEFLNLPSPKSQEASLNLALPASHCPHCQHSIRWWENIPVISYLVLHGKCSNCQTRISLQYPLVEILSGLLSAFVLIHFGAGWTAIAGLLLTWALLTLSIIDIETQLLPDDITLPLLWLGLLLNIFHAFVSITDAVIGAMAGYLILWLVYWGFKKTTGKEGMGYGDFKLLGALGAWMGWQVLPAIILISSLTGAIIGIAWLIWKRQDSQTPIPFGPFLAGAGWLSLVLNDYLSPEALLNWLG